MTITPYASPFASNGVKSRRDFADDVGDSKDDPPTSSRSNRDTREHPDLNRTASQRPLPEEPFRSGCWVINAAFLREIKDSCSDEASLRRRAANHLCDPVLHLREARQLCETLEQWRDSLAMLFALEQTYGYVELPNGPIALDACDCDRLRSKIDDAENHSPALAASDVSLNRIDHAELRLFRHHFDNEPPCEHHLGVPSHVPIEERLEDTIPSLMPPTCLLLDHDRLYTRLQAIIDRLSESIVHGAEPAELDRHRHCIEQLIADVEQHDAHERRWSELTSC